MINFQERLLKWRWWVITILAVAIVIFEILESPHLANFYIHLTEIILYWIFLAILGVLVELLAINVNAKTRAVKLLEFEQSLSFQLAQAKDWDDLIDNVVQNLASVTDPLYLYLLTFDHHIEKYETVAEKSFGEIPPPALSAQLSRLCLGCKFNTLESQSTTRLCTDCDVKKFNLPKSYNLYCLPLNYGAARVGFIYVYMPQDKYLSEDQLDTLDKIHDSIAVALFTALQRCELDEIRLAEATQAERHSLSRDLHDTLSQNLAFLRMQLEQMSMDGFPADGRDIKPQLVQMSRIADESLDIIRGTLATLNADATPMLTNLLLDHSRKVSERANFPVDLATKGQPRPLLPTARRQVFYIFREALSNVEKHAQATRVDVNMIWEDDDLVLKISDDGKGFNSHSVDAAHHYGLRIIQERAETLGGRFEIHTSPGKGTEISLHIPV